MCVAVIVRVLFIYRIVCVCAMSVGVLADVAGQWWLGDEEGQGGLILVVSNSCFPLPDPWCQADTCECSMSILFM